MGRVAAGGVVEQLERLTALRQHQKDGHRAPHKPLLVLLALGHLEATGSSVLPWSQVEQQLAELIAEFGPASRTSPRQAAAYPFTRLRSDGVWQLSAAVPMDAVAPLSYQHVSGRFPPELEQALSEKSLRHRIARAIVDGQFPSTVAPDVLLAVGLDPDVGLDLTFREATLVAGAIRRRSAQWRADVLQAWDRQCAFCGYDGALAGAPVGLEAAHVRWFTFDGPDDLDNGIALCALHHKLFDRGALGLSPTMTIEVSSSYTAATENGRSLYTLHGRTLTPRQGTPLPAEPHVAWHRREVFKGRPLAA